jgi:hypothetical protein
MLEENYQMLTQFVVHTQPGAAVDAKTKQQLDE